MVLVEALISTKDRPFEMGLLLTSLLQQARTCRLDLCIITEGKDIREDERIKKLLGHFKGLGTRVRVFKADFQGVCASRNQAISVANPEADYYLRVDDDVILDPHYVSDMVRYMEEHPDVGLVSGVTPLIGMAYQKRDVTATHGFFNKMKYNTDGLLVEMWDDCGQPYMNGNEVMYAHHFRSCALYKRRVHEVGIKYPTWLSPVGFREETFFSIQTILKGMDVAILPWLNAWHFQSPSGGCRYPNYQQLVQGDHALFLKWMQQQYRNHGDFLEAYHDRLKK